MKKLFLCFAFLWGGIATRAQDSKEIIQLSDVQRIENTLANDSMQGRKIFTPGIEKASRFIEQEFAAAGLQPLPGDNGYRQEFAMVSAKLRSAKLVIGGKRLDTSSLIVISTQKKLNWTDKRGIKIVKIFPQDNFYQEIFKYYRPGQDVLLLADEKFAPQFSRLKSFSIQSFPSPYSTVIILGNTDAKQFNIRIRNGLVKKPLNNVVGMLPGKSRKDEYVVFSAHYDHLGIKRPVLPEEDSIFNGANDDASGTTAVIELARYFKALNNNERTLIFAAFTGEEEGGYGSGYFSKQLNPDKVAAMFNIEMIGTESKWGTNSAYITGYEKSDFGKILRRNLEGTGFQFYPDPYPKENLFYRSDNATLARQGVPAHTISTSKMDNEPNYHKVSDEVSTLDLANMTAIIRAIALSSATIVEGKDTPSRVNPQELKR